MLIESPLSLPTNFGRVARGPGPFDQGTTGLGNPALVMAPCRRRSPLESSEGISPKNFMRGLGLSKRVRSPSSAPVVTATVLAQDFAPLVCERRADQLDSWLARAADSPFVPLQRFAKGLRDDYDPVKAGLT